GLGNPALLLLRAHQQRDHRRLLPALRIFGDRLLRPRRIHLGEGEAGWLDGWLCKSADAHGLAVNLSENDVDRAEDGSHIGQHVLAAQEIHRLQMREARRAQLAAVRLVGAVGDEIDAELALRRFHGGVYLARRHMVAFLVELKGGNHPSHRRLIAPRLGGTILPSMFECGPCPSLLSSFSTHWRMIFADWRISSMRMR